MGNRPITLPRSPRRTGKVRERAPRPPVPVGLAAALFTRTQQFVLGALFGEPGRSFSVSELISGAGGASGSVQRELARLVQCGIVALDTAGRTKRYRANPQSPIHAELTGIIRKTVRLVDPVRAALQPLLPQIESAFIYGSIAKGNEGATSDIDLMLLFDSLSYAEVMRVLDAPATNLQRKISPTLYSREEWEKRRRQGNTFVKRVLEQPRLWIYGDPHASAA